MKAYQFRYRGGVLKPDSHRNEKFLLFFIVGGREISFHQMRKDSLVWQISETEPDYFTTSVEHVKIFFSEQGFGIQKRYHSFYMALSADMALPEVRVVPFSQNPSFYFKARVTFLRREEILQILDAEAESVKFIGSQKTLPLDVLKKIISVDRAEMGKGLRHVRIRGTQNPEVEEVVSGKAK